MLKKAIALIPLVARLARRRRRQSNARRGAKLGAPALLGLGGAAAAFLIRRRKRGAAGFDVSPQELRRTDPPRADAARSDADVATGAGAESNGAAAIDTLGASAAAAGTPSPDADVVMPDTGADDPLVREQTNAAAAEAGAIGGPPPDLAGDEPTFADDPATRPVEEHAGNSYEAFSDLEQDR
jgi:hypothetical protein